MKQPTLAQQEPAYTEVGHYQLHEWGLSLHCPVTLDQTKEEIVEMVACEAIAIIEERYHADRLCEDWGEKVILSVARELEKPDVIDEEGAYVTISNESYLIR